VNTEGPCRGGKIFSYPFVNLGVHFLFCCCCYLCCLCVCVYFILLDKAKHVLPLCFPVVESFPSLFPRNLRSLTRRLTISKGHKKVSSRHRATKRAERTRMANKRTTKSATTTTTRAINLNTNNILYT
jgi:hypothetical protein